MSDRICGSHRVGREIWRVEEGVGGQVHDDRGGGVEISPEDSAELIRSHVRFSSHVALRNHPHRDTRSHHRPSTTIRLHSKPVASSPNHGFSERENTSSLASSSKLSLWIPVSPWVLVLNRGRKPFRILRTLPLTTHGLYTS